MSTRRSPFGFGALAARLLSLVGCVSVHAVAIPMEFVTDIEIVELTLVGEAEVPLGSAGNSTDYRFVNSRITVSESPTLQSMLTAKTTVLVDFDSIVGTDPFPQYLQVPVTTSLRFDFFPVVDIVDIDPDPGDDFTGGPVHLESADPLLDQATLEAFFTIEFLDIATLSDITSEVISQSVTPSLLKIGPLPLFVDVNENGEPDFIAVTLQGFDFDAANFDLVGNGLSITGATVVAGGEVADVLTDPPFGPVTLNQPTAAPAPGTLALVAVALAVAALRRRRTISTLAREEERAA